MRSLSTFILLCCITFSAQARGDLSIKGIVAGDFRAETLDDVEPLDDGVSYAQISSDGKRIEKYSFKTGKRTATMVDLDNVRTEGGSRIESIDGYVVSPKGDKILIQTNTAPIYRHSFTADYYIFETDNNRMVPLDDEGRQQIPMFSPDGTMIAFVRDNNIFLVKLLYNNSLSQVTKDGEKNKIINGLPDWVNEEEFAVRSSMVFTADSKQICYVKYDETDVREFSFPLYKEGTYPGAYSYKYPKAGEDNARVAAYSFDIKSKQTRKLQVPLDEDGYIPRIEATADPAKVAVFTLNRHQDLLAIYMVNPLSTEAKLAVKDQTAKYIRQESVEGVRIEGNSILVPSERDGYCHLYLYNLSGQLKRQITSGQYEVTEAYGYDEVTGDTYYAANKDGVTESQVYVTHANGKTDKLTAKAGWNTAIFSKGYKYFINIWSDLDTPTQYSISTNQGKLLTTLIDNSKLKTAYGQKATGKKELFTFTTSEGITLNGWMVKPADFSPSKRYPVIMYQYGGPGSQQVRNAWNIGSCGQGAIMEQYMAQEGYIVVCVDNRGTGGRGADFERCTYLRLGEKESADQVEAALWLGRQPYVDKERIGIWGWSYGGWNTLMSMSEGRAVFKAGVAVAPPTCWRYYDTIYTERYMRTPKENASGYDGVNPIARADKLSGKLLICHGTADDNVHYQNTADYTDALVEADKDFKEIIYTDRNHGIFGGNTRNHLYRQIVGWFNENLE